MVLAWSQWAQRLPHFKVDQGHGCVGRWVHLHVPV